MRSLGLQSRRPHDDTPLVRSNTGFGVPAIVADLGSDPLPGRADFNAYRFVVVDAAMHLCPAHRSEFSSTPGV